MAEFCPECMNKFDKTHNSKWRYVLSRDLELCEECGKFKRVVVAERFWSKAQRFLIDIANSMKRKQ